MNVDDLLTAIERAVDAHPRLRRVNDDGVALRVTRLGWSAYAFVKLIGSRKHATSIHADGDTAEEATAKLVAGLDIWARAIE